MNSEFLKKTTINPFISLQHIKDDKQDEIRLLVHETETKSCINYDGDNGIHTIRLTKDTALKTAFALLRFYFTSSPGNPPSYFAEYF